MLRQMQVTKSEILIVNQTIFSPSIFHNIISQQKKTHPVSAKIMGAQHITIQGISTPFLHTQL